MFLPKMFLPFIYSSDAGGLLIGHTDVLSRTEEQRGQMEVSCLHLYRKSFFYRPSLKTLCKRERDIYIDKLSKMVFEDGG